MESISTWKTTKQAQVMQRLEININHFQVKGTTFPLPSSSPPGGYKSIRYKLMAFQLVSLGKFPISLQVMV